MKRDWSAALEKVAREGECRVCGAGRPEAAHTVGRRYDEKLLTGNVRVRPQDVVPLCRVHHVAYDAHLLDLVPYLTREEQAAAVEHVGLVRALHRLAGSVVDKLPARV